jgi:hypothetical protein
MGSGGTGAGGSNSGPIGSSGPRAGLGSPGAQGQVGNYSGTPGGGGGSGGYVQHPVTTSAGARQAAIAMGPAALTSSNPSIRYAALHLQQEAADRASGMPGGAPQAGQTGYVRR